ncbi:MAG: hypothetical protein DRJ40_08725 [Thermoprotei archaeon]|nr:MAG: hypothetical protein DRJ40_08725 [Thermoprotei archaeon]
MSSRIVQYKRELLDFIKSRGGVVTASMLREWAQKRGIGDITLREIISELARSGQIECSSEKEVISRLEYGGTVIETIEIPKVVAIRGRSGKREGTSHASSLLQFLYPSEEVKRGKPSEGKASPSQSTSVPSTPSLREERVQVKGGRSGVQLKVLEEGKVVRRKVVEVKEREISAVGKELLELVRSTISQDLILSEFKREGLKDVEVVYELILRVVEYLSKYWSVGELRLKEDLWRIYAKSEVNKLLKVLGVSVENLSESELREIVHEKLEKVLRILRRVGWIERKEPGIINATGNMPRGISRELKFGELL